MDTKNYYLPNFRAVIIGIILITMGVGLSLIRIDMNKSFVENFQIIMIGNSQSVFSFLCNLFLFLIKMTFIVIGFLVLKNRKEIIRAKLDNKGFYFKEIPKGNRISKTMFDFRPLTFVAYSDILDIYYVENFFRGSHLEIKTKTEQKVLISLNVLSNREKIEIYNIIKDHSKNLN